MHSLASGFPSNPNFRPSNSRIFEESPSHYPSRRIDRTSEPSIAEGEGNDMIVEREGVLIGEDPPPRKSAQLNMSGAGSLQRVYDAIVVSRQ